jgi:signal transduction histidine kinase
MPVDPPATNALLDRFDAVTALAFAGTIEDVKSGQVLLQCGAPEIHVYFPITAVLSLMSTMASGDTCEVALVGREGMVGLAGVLTASDSPASCVVQMGGTCLRTSAEAVRSARNSDTQVRETLDSYTTARLIQVAQVAACNRLHPIGSRLARWILMLRDRVDHDHLQLSQQSIADALGVHRPTIALELQRLDNFGAIVYRSRIVRIANRARLESLACECHEALHGEYMRAFRPPSHSTSRAAATSDGSSGGATIEALRSIAGRLLITSLQEQAARERAEAADRAKDQFVAMVSHELRSPLQAILGWCALAKLPNPPPGAIEVIERNARAQAAMIEDLIDSARVNASTLRISPREINPVSVVESAIETIRPAAEAKHISLQLNVMDELAPVVADDDRLRQVLVNVLMNSVKFSPEGGRVDMVMSSRDESVEVRVIDRGDGIPAEMLPHVFERFWQGQGSSRTSHHGLGLGLSIARALIELHGGTIHLASSGHGQGTTCTIVLPRTPLAQTPTVLQGPR